MRIVFAGTPEAAVPSLRRLVAGSTRPPDLHGTSPSHRERAGSRHEIVAVVTRTDAPLGRKRILTPSPVAQAAAGFGIETIKTDRLDAAATERISALDADLGVIVAYGGLVREPLLSAPAHGWVNLHFSLLPRWRGAAPVQRALMAGDAVTGAAVFRLVPELDAGDVYGQLRHAIAPGATAGDLLAELAASGAELLADVVDAIADGTAVATPQSGEPTFAPKLTLEDGLIRWEDPRDAVLARLRGVTPEPGAHTTLDGARLKVLAAGEASADAPSLAPGALAAHGGEVLAGTGTAPIALRTVQPAGKGAMAAGDWWRGLRLDDPVAGR